jgi:hypothetical protein
MAPSFADSLAFMAVFMSSVMRALRLMVYFSERSPEKRQSRQL